MERDKVLLRRYWNWVCNYRNIMLLCREGDAPHSSTLAWKTPWTEDPGGLQSVGSRRVGHDWVTSLSLFIFLHWRRKWQPTPVFLPGESQGRGSLVGSVHGVAQSRTRLKWLSSSSSSLCQTAGTGRGMAIVQGALWVRKQNDKYFINRFGIFPKTFQ